MKDIIIRHAKIVTPLGRCAVKGKSMNDLCIIEDGAVVCRNGIITFCGNDAELSAIVSNLNPNEFETINAKGKVLLPGFVDSHTHAVFGGYRADEFEWRLKGESYMSIMQRGGGIQSTVNATRSASKEALYAKTQWFIDKMSEMGVTTVEMKSGYGLDLPAELKMLEVIDSLSENPNQKLRIVATYLGAHAIPREYSGKTGEYIDFMINEVLPEVKGKARFCDIFTEKNVFEIEESRRFMQAAREMGFELKFHADEIYPLGGAQLAAELGAVSADHLLHISDEGIDCIRQAGVVATLLPLTAFSLKEEYAPARKLINRGVAVALATDLNPGSCFSGSIPLTIALSTIYMDMTIEETITALTLNGAAALGLAGVTGSIEVGKSADMVILDFDNYKTLSYYIGMNCVNTVISQGKIISNKFTDHGK